MRPARSVAIEAVIAASQTAPPDRLGLLARLLAALRRRLQRMSR